MSSVDNRTVKMHWDGADFDKACENSKQILMQMQQTLDGINGKVASINVDGLNSAADSVVNKFSWMGTMIDQILRNIADKALEVGKNIASALTIDPMKSGFDEYQTMMDTMRVISNNLNMGKKLVIDTDALDSEEFQQQLASGAQVSLFGTYAKFEDREQTSMETIEGHLNELNKYADKTIYNFQEMTSAIGKFINAGVDNLDDAVAAIQGLSNLSALSGATSEQNGRAMYNMAQVLSTGYLNRMDYNQFTKTQGLGKIFNDALIQAAADLGRFDTELGEHEIEGWQKAWQNTSEYRTQAAAVRKDYKDRGLVAPGGMFNIRPDEQWIKDTYGEDAYLTADGRVMRRQRQNVHTFSNNQGKEKTAEEILEMIANSNGNLSEVVQYRVFDSEVMLKALSMFSDETTELGQAAFKAATEVRSLKQLKDVIAEGLGSGWTNTWRYVIGEDPDEATAIWTGLYNVINPVIDETAQARNEMFKFWHDQGGRKAVLKGIGAAFEYITKFIKPLKEHWDSKSAWAQLTSEERGKVLRKYSNEFRRWAMHLENLQWRTNALKNVLDLLHTPLDWIGSFFEHGGGYTILSSLGKIRDILLKVANLEAKAITRLFSDNDPGELLANWAGVFDAFLGHITNRLKEGKDGLNKILFDFFQAAMRPFKWIMDSLQRVRLDDLLNILTDAFDIAVSLIEAITAGFNQATDNIDVDKLAEYVSWIAKAVERWRQFFASSKGMALVTSAAEAFFSFFRMGLDLVIAKWMLIVDIVDQFFEAARPFVTKYITPILNFLGPIFRYVGQIALAFEKWVRESGIVYNIFRGIFKTFGTGIDWVIDRINSILSIFGVQLPKIGDDFDPKTIFGDPYEWVPKVMDNIVAAFKKLGSKLGDIPKLITGEMKWRDFVDGLIPKGKDEKRGIIGSALVGDFGTVKDSLVEMTGGTEGWLNKFIGVITSAFDKVKNFLLTIFDSVVKGFQEKGILGAIGAGFMTVIGKIAELSNKIGDAIAKMFEKLSATGGPFKMIGDFFSNLFGKKKKGEGIESVGDTIEEEGAKIMHGFGFLDAFKKKAEDFLEIINGLLYGKGDSKILALLSKGGDLYGLTLIYNLINTFIKKLGNFNKEVGGFQLALTGAVNNFGGMFKSIGGTFDGFKDSWKRMFDSIVSNANKIFTSVAEGMPKLMVQVSKGVRKVLTGFAKGLPKLMTSFGKGLEKSLKGLGDMFKDVGKGVEKYMKGKAFNERAEGILKIAGAIGIMAAAVWLLAQIPADKMKVATTILIALAVVLGIVAIAVSRFSKTTNTLAGAAGKFTSQVAPKVKEMTSGLDSFLKKAGLAILLLAFAGALVKVSKALQRLSDIPGEKLLSATIAIAACTAFLTAAIIALDECGKTGIRQAIGNFITMLALTIAIKSIAKAIVKIGQLDVNQIAAATVCLTAMMTFFTIMMGFSKFTKDAKIFAIVALSFAIGTLTGAVKSLSRLKPEKLIPATACLAVLMGMFALMEKMAGQIQSGKSLAGIVLMGALVAGITLIIYKLTELPIGDVIGVAASLSAVLLSISVAMATARLAGEGAAASLIGIALIGVFIAAMTALITLIGSLFVEHDEWMAGLKKGVKVMSLLGKAIGKFVGNILKGVAKGLLEGVADGIAALGEGIRSFADSTSGIDSSGAKAIVKLAGAMLAITGADLLNSITGFFTGGNPYKKFAKGLSVVAPAIASFSKDVGSVGKGKVDTAANAAKMLSSFAKNLPKSGGVLSIFTGGNQYKNFAKGLSELVDPLKVFLNKIGNAKFDNETIKQGIGVGKMISEFAKSLPNDGGLVGGIFGNNNIGDFGKGLGSFTNRFIKFINAVGEANIDTAKVDTAGYVMDSVIAWAKKIPNSGGLLGGILGDNDLADFAEGLASAGPNLVAYSQSMEGFNAEAVTNSQAAVDAIMAFANAVPTNAEGSLMGLLFGNNSVKGFGKDLAKFGKSVVKYAKSLRGITSEDITKISDITAVVKPLAWMAKRLPTLDGLLQKIIGAQSFASFGNDLASFAGSMDTYVTSLPKLTKEDKNNMAHVNDATEKLITLSEKLPKVEGLGDLVLKILGGETSFEKFGNDLAAYGGLFAQYVEALPDFTDQDLANMDAVVGATEKLAELYDKLPGIEGLSDLIAKLFGTDDKFTSFGNDIAAFGNSIATYSGNISGVDVDKILSVNDAVIGISKMLDTAQSASNFSLNGAINALDTAKDFVVDFVDAMVKEINNPDTTQLNLESAAETMAGYIFNGLNAGYYNNSETFTGKGETIANDFINTFTKAINEDTSMNSTLYGAIDTVMTEAYKRIDNEYENYKGLGSHLVSGIVIGVNTKSVDLYTCMHNLAVNAYNEAANALQVRSPSKKFMQLGEYIDLGIINGINKRADEVDKSIVSSLTTPLKTLDALLSGDIDYQPVISPMLDLSMVKAGAGQLNGFFSDRTIRLAEINDEIQNQQKVARAQMAEVSGYNDSNVISAINGLNESMYSVQDAISKMGITLDDGTLVGKIAPRIDRSIGRSKVMARRGKL